MGASVGAAARRGGAEVVWASEGRSASTHARAVVDSLRDVGTLQNLVKVSDVIVSVCPPGVAADVAYAVAGYRFSRVYVDANAVSPQTARKVGAIVEQGGATFVDGGIIGPPARSAGSTRLYLLGPAAQQVAPLFKDGPLEVIVLEGGPGPPPRSRWRSPRTPRALRRSCWRSGRLRGPRGSMPPWCRSGHTPCLACPANAKGPCAGAPARP